MEYLARDGRHGGHRARVRECPFSLAQKKVVNGMGFGWSFYGFFAAAAVWMVLYFAWALAVDARDRRRDQR